MSASIAPNSALELFREEFAEGLQGAINACEIGEDVLEPFLRIADAFEKIAHSELAQWLNIIAELGARVDDGLAELDGSLAEAVKVTTYALLDTAHLGVGFLSDNPRIVSAASTSLAWCALASADPATARYVAGKHPAALTAALEILDDATAHLG